MLGSIMIGIAGAITFAIAQHHELHLVGVEELRLDGNQPVLLTRM